MDTNEIIYRTTSGAVTPLEIGAYPGGEPLVKWHTAERIDAALLRPSSVLSFMTALWWIDALAERGHPVPELILPYVPGARQDRLNESGDYLFTALSVAREINLRNFPRVTVVDPHSDVAPALIERCRVVHAADDFSFRGMPGPEAAALSGMGHLLSFTGTDTIPDSGMKNSAKGRLAVLPGDAGMVLVNQASEADQGRSLLRPVWRDGRFIRRLTFADVRGNCRRG